MNVVVGSIDLFAYADEESASDELCQLLVFFHIGDGLEESFEFGGGEAGEKGLSCVAEGEVVEEAQQFSRVMH